MCDRSCDTTLECERFNEHLVTCITPRNSGHDNVNKLPKTSPVEIATHGQIDVDIPL